MKKSPGRVSSSKAWRSSDRGGEHTDSTPKASTALNAMRCTALNAMRDPLIVGVDEWDMERAEAPVFATGCEY